MKTSLKLLIALMAFTLVGFSTQAQEGIIKLRPASFFWQKTKPSEVPGIFRVPQYAAPSVGIAFERLNQYSYHLSSETAVQVVIANPVATDVNGDTAFIGTPTGIEVYSTGALLVIGQSGRVYILDEAPYDLYLGIYTDFAFNFQFNYLRYGIAGQVGWNLITANDYLSVDFNVTAGYGLVFSELKSNIDGGFMMMPSVSAGFFF